MAGIKNMPAVVNSNPNAMLDGRTGKPKRLTKSLRRCIELLLTGECTTIKAAGERVQLRPDYLSRAFRQPHVVAFIEERTRAVLSSGKMLATSRLLELIRAKSEHVSLDASVATLGINGIAPPERGNVNVSVNSNVVAGYVVCLTKYGDEPGDRAIVSPYDAKPTGKYTIDNHGHRIADDDPLKPWEITPVGTQIP